MRRIDKIKFHNNILSIVLNLPFDNLIFKAENGINNYYDEKGCLGYAFSIRFISRLLKKKLGYWVRTEEIKHALKSIKIGKGYYFVRKDFHKQVYMAKEILFGKDKEK